MANTAGILSGKILAERQWWSVLRIVGRIHWFLRFTDEVNLSTFKDLNFAVCWGFLKWKVDEQGRPVGDFPDPFDLDDQDEKWLHKDYERILIPNSTTYLAGQRIPVSVGPWYGYHDIRVRRKMRNEEDLFLVAGANACDIDGGFVDLGDQWELDATLNFRVLGKFA